MTTSSIHAASAATYTTAPNLSIDIGDTTLAYRDLGPRDGVPVILPEPLGRSSGQLRPAHRRWPGQSAPCHRH